MALTDSEVRKLTNRILMSRMRLLSSSPFYGLLLMHMNFGIEKNIDTIGTDGRAIYFNPEFIDLLSDDELDFILMHEVMHCVLKHMGRLGNREEERFNMACDIVANSLICESSQIDISDFKNIEVVHYLPDGTNGCDVTAEEAYERITVLRGKSIKNDYKRFDEHSKWVDTNSDDADDTLEAEWDEHLKKAVEALRHRKGEAGNIPMFAERMYKELTNPKTDWKTVLTNFVQENIKDYSFNPPDKRYMDSDFLMPDFNDSISVDSVKNVLFMVDTSGSIDDEELTKAYSEIKGAIDQFDGRLTGKLGFFDSSVKGVYDFCDEDELLSIKPIGGGGTSFECIFKYMDEKMEGDDISNIVILTDGYATFPDEKVRRGVPVLWLLTNDVVTPPWGNIARM